MTAGGGFARWLRASWLVPALAAVAAVALAVFGKPIEPPRTRVAEPTAQPSPPVPAASPAREPSQLEGNGKRSAADVQNEPAKAARSARARTRAPNDGFAVPPPAWNPQPQQPGRRQEERRYAQPPATSSAANAPHAAVDEREAPLMQDKATAAVGQASTANAEPRAAAAAKRELADDEGDRDTLAPAAPASAAPAAPAMGAGPVARKAASNAVAEPAADSEPAPRADSTTPRTANDLERRAREHLAARRWQLAAADYRELLRRYPNDVRVAAWKKQLAAAKRALGGAERGSR